MEKELSHLDAWANFYTWVNLPENWANVDRAGRDRIKKAHRRYLFKEPADLGYDGVKNLLTKYAHDRYRFEERVILIEP